MPDLNKYFLQYMLCNGALKCEEGDSLLRNFAAKIDEPEKDFNTVVSEINGKISKQLFRLDIKTCEITGAKMCVLINKSIDEISSSAANHTAAELELFNKILTAVMTSDSKCISSIMCLNLTSRMKTSISKDQAQEIMDSWVNCGYLVKEEGYIYLGARTISEFEMFFKAQFSARMTTCRLCTDFVYYGKICAECNEVLHIHCSSKYIAKTSKCPACKKPWKEAEGRTYEEEESENEADDSMDTD